MHIIVCVDDGGGMLFHKRRQSQDRILREHILNDTSGARLWMNAYSFRQFSDMKTVGSGQIVVEENFMDQAEAGDFCFLENVSAKDYEDKIEQVILYKWNRSYPSDFKFDIPLEESGWKLENREEFEGFSHEKITKEVYRR